MLREYDASTTADELVDKLASEIQGKVVLTTGISPGGIGDTFVSSIARGQPAMLILANRNPSKAQPVADAIKEAHPRVKVRLLALDLISFAAVRKAAATVNSWADVPHLDVVVTNAGIMGVDFKLSPDGFESTLATNHLGHFLFVNLIMPKLLASEAPRVVSVSSDGHRDSPIRWGDYNFSVQVPIPLPSRDLLTRLLQNGETYNKWSAYGQSKTANALMAVSLAKKLGTKNLTAVSLHPGVVMSSHLGDHIDWSVDMETLRKCFMTAKYHAIVDAC